MGTTKTAVVYVRTSTKGQRDAATIDAQIARCKSLVAAHRVKLIPYGAKQDGWIRDDGVSGSLLEGRAFAGLIEDLEHGRLRVDYLVTYSMSRLARHDKSSRSMQKLVRSATDKARIMAVLNGAEVKIIDTDGVNDPASIMTEIKETLSAEEYRAIRKRTLDGKARVLGNGAWATGGRVPYGYRRAFVNGQNRKLGTTLAPCPVDAPRLVQLVDWYVEGGVTHASVEAQKAGWPAPRGGSSWYPSTVQQILKRARQYLGESTLSITGQQFDVSYPPLIDLRTYARIERRRKETTIRQRTVLLGTGYVDCACGAHITTHRSSTTDAYYCRCRNGCGTFRESIFQEKLWDAVVSRLVEIKEHEQGATTDAVTPKLNAARGRLASVQEQMDRLVAAYSLGTIDETALSNTNASLKAEKAKLKTEVERLERERRARTSRATGVETVQSRVRLLLKRLRAGVDLDGKRRILGDLLQGARVILSLERTQTTITLPSFGDLPAVVVGLFQVTSQQVLDVIHQTDDVVEDVAL